MKHSKSRELKELDIKLAAFKERFEMHEYKWVSDAHGSELSIKNTTSGVQFEWAPREGRGWRVMLVRLTASEEFPPYPIFVTPDTQLDYFDLRDVLSLRSQCDCSCRNKINQKLPLTADDAIEALNACCADVLTGDFTLFRNLASLVKSRIKK